MQRTLWRLICYGGVSKGRKFYLWNAPFCYMRFFVSGSRSRCVWSGLGAGGGDRMVNKSFTVTVKPKSNKTNMQKGKFIWGMRKIWMDTTPPPTKVRKHDLGITFWLYVVLWIWHFTTGNNQTVQTRLVDKYRCLISSYGVTNRYPRVTLIYMAVISRLPFWYPKISDTSLPTK